MKVFERDSKINFIDKNNVLVGYDLSRDCCETADWFISSSEDNDIENKERLYELEDYCFDKNYFEEVIPAQSDGWSVLDDGRMVRFKLIADGKPELFLHLYNNHNGYYSHGFEATIGGLDWKEGCL